MIWLLALFAWTFCAMLAGCVVGLVIRERDRHEEQPGRPWVAREGYATDEELWEAQMRHPSGRDVA